MNLVDNHSKHMFFKPTVCSCCTIFQTSQGRKDKCYQVDKPHSYKLLCKPNVAANVFQFHNDLLWIRQDTCIRYSLYIFLHSNMGSHTLLKRSKFFRFYQTTTIVFNLRTKFTVKTKITLWTLASIFLDTFSTVQTFFRTNTCNLNIQIVYLDR